MSGVSNPQPCDLQVLPVIEGTDINSPGSVTPSAAPDKNLKL